MADNQAIRHACVTLSPSRSCGTAVKYCVEYLAIAGVFWAGNGEYESQVNFCPVCGTKAPVQTPSQETDEGQELFDALNADWGSYSPWIEGEAIFETLLEQLLERKSS